MIRVVEAEPHRINKVFDLCIQMAEDMKIAGYDDMDEPWSKKNLRNVMINPQYKFYIAERNMEWVGFVIVRADVKLWNKKTVGELVLIWTRKDVRRGDEVADALMDAAKTWFKEMECHYFQTSVLMFDDNYQARTDVIEKAKNYWERYGLEMVGYNFVQQIEYEEPFYLSEEELEELV